MRRVLVLALLLPSVAHAATVQSSAVQNIERRITNLEQGANVDACPSGQNVWNPTTRRWTCVPRPACAGGVYSSDAITGALKCMALPATPCSQLVWTGSEFACASPGTIWTNTVTPPEQTNPVTITLDGTDQTGAGWSVVKNATGSVTTNAACNGGAGGTVTSPRYNVTLDKATDYIIRASTKILFPLYIGGGRVVRVIGIHLEPAPVCIHTTTPYGITPGTIAMRFETVGTVFAEGLYVDTNGADGDAITIRNQYDGATNNGNGLDDGLTVEQARAGHDIYIVNSVFRGIRGNDTTAHGDILQSQYSAEVFNALVMENVTVDSVSQGLMMAPSFPTATPASTTHKFATSTIRRFDYRQDTRINIGTAGAAAFLSSGSETYADVYTYPVTGYQGLGAWTHYPNPAATYNWYAVGGGTDGSSRTDELPAGIHLGALPPGTDRFAAPGTALASDAWVGLNYASPF